MVLATPTRPGLAPGPPPGLSRRGFAGAAGMCVAGLWTGGATSANPGTHTNFWQQTRHGANVFNREVPGDTLRAARRHGFEFVRLAPDKFPSRQRDFLLGSADHYQGLVADDLDRLTRCLDRCAQAGLPVLLTLLSLPGSRWRQHNGFQDDQRLWDSPDFERQALRVWHDLVARIGRHSALVGINPLNEPHLEKRLAPAWEALDAAQRRAVQDRLAAFYRQVLATVRALAPELPVVLDSAGYASPRAFVDMPVLDDPQVLYAFHLYEPFDYTNRQRNRGRYRYPGTVAGQHWNRAALAAYVQPVVDFQRRHRLPGHRILVGEFGGHRMSPGLARYFSDLTDLFRQHGWHWAVYAFREDTWDGMDYELGTAPLPAAAWRAQAQGRSYPLARSAGHPAFQTLLRALR